YCAATRTTASADVSGRCAPAEPTRTASPPTQTMGGVSHNDERLRTFRWRTFRVRNAPRIAPYRSAVPCNSRTRTDDRDGRPSGEPRLWRRFDRGSGLQNVTSRCQVCISCSIDRNLLQTWHRDLTVCRPDPRYTADS